MPIRVRPALAGSSGCASANSPRAAVEHRRPSAPSGARACASASRASVVEAQAEHDRPAHAVGRPQRRMTRSTARRDRRRAPPRNAAAARTRAASRSSRRRRPVRAPAAGRALCASACRWRPARAAEHRHQRRLRRARATCADRRDPARRGASPPSSAPTPQSRSTGSGCRNSQLAVGRDDAAGRPASRPRSRPSRGTSSARSPTVIGRPDRVANLAPEPRARSRAACRRSAPSRARRGTPRRSRAPRRAASCPRRPRRGRLLPRV